MTLFEKFKKDHPNAPIDDGVPMPCPSSLGYAKIPSNCDSCVNCWNREYEGEDNLVETVEESKDKSIADKIADVRNGLIDRAFNEAYAERIIMSLIDRGYFDK